MSELILHPMVEKLLLAYSQHLRGSILINGPKGADLPAVLKYLLSQIYQEEIVKLESTNTYLLQDYTIEAVRQIVASLGVKHVNRHKLRLILILEVEKLRPDAANALLKILEEPPSDTRFILTSHQLTQVLPTIKSRCQILKIRQPPKPLIFQKCADYDEALVEKAYLAGNGWPAEVISYLEDENSLLRLKISTAREFLSYPRLKRLHYLTVRNKNPSEQKQLLEKLLDGLYATTRGSLIDSARKGQEDKVRLYQQKFLDLHRLRQDFWAAINQRLIALLLFLKT